MAVKQVLSPYGVEEEEPRQEGRPVLTRTRIALASPPARDSLVASLLGGAGHEEGRRKEGRKWVFEEKGAGCLTA